MKTRFAFVVAFSVILLLSGCDSRLTEDDVGFALETWDTPAAGEQPWVEQETANGEGGAFPFLENGRLTIYAPPGCTVQYQTSDPSALEIVALSSTQLTLRVLSPAGRSVILTLSIAGQNGGTVDTQLALFFADRVRLSNYIDFDNGVPISYTQWTAMDQQSQAQLDCQIWHDSSVNIFDFFYGYLALTTEVFDFASYSRYPDGTNLPVGSFHHYLSEYPPMWILVKTSEGRFFKVDRTDFGNGLIFIELTPRL